MSIACHYWPAVGSQYAAKAHAHIPHLPTLLYLPLRFEGFDGSNCLAACLACIACVPVCLTAEDLQVIRTIRRGLLAAY